MNNIIDIEKHIIDAMNLSNDLVCNLREAKYRVTNGPAFLEYASVMFSNFLLDDTQNIAYEAKHQSLKMSCHAFISQLKLSTYNDIDPQFKDVISSLFTNWEELIKEILNGAKARADTYLSIEKKISNNEDLNEYGKKIIHQDEGLEIISVIKKEEDDDKSKSS